MAGENISPRFVVPTVAASVDVVVHLGIDQHGHRRVHEIVGVPGRVAIACVAGVLWITAPETGDVVLVAGDATTIENRGRIVIEALQTAEFDIETDDKLVEELRLFGTARKSARVANDN